MCCYDGSGATPQLAQSRTALNVTFSENTGTGERLDLMCGHFAFAAPHRRCCRSYLPRVLVVQAAERSASTARPGTGAQLAGLVALMRAESALDSLGGRAMLNALSTAMFTLILRLAGEAKEAPAGLLALAGHPAWHRLDRAVPRADAPLVAAGASQAVQHVPRYFRAALPGHAGKSAGELLTDIRMTLAANELKKPSASTAAVAETVGYRSEAAFQRGFKQRMGMTPARWRKTVQVAEPSGLPPLKQWLDSLPSSSGKTRASGASEPCCSGDVSEDTKSWA